MLILLKPFLYKYESMQLYQALGACLSPYNIFFNWYTFFSSPLVSKLGDCSTYISSSNTPLRMLILHPWWTFYLCWVVISKTTLIVSILSIGEKGFIAISSMFLFIPFDHKSCFMYFNSSFHIIIGFKKPLHTNNLFSCWKVY